jgi:hypothetical protein
MADSSVFCRETALLTPVLLKLSHQEISLEQRAQSHEKQNQHSWLKQNPLKPFYPYEIKNTTILLYA